MFQVFTTIALINMLIAPLNAFPWVLNGLTEAWVSIKRIQKLLDVSNIQYLFYIFLEASSASKIIVPSKLVSFVVVVWRSNWHPKQTYKRPNCLIYNINRILLKTPKQYCCKSLIVISKFLLCENIFFFIFFYFLSFLTIFGLQ